MIWGPRPSSLLRLPNRFTWEISQPQSLFYYSIAQKSSACPTIKKNKKEMLKRRCKSAINHNSVRTNTSHFNYFHLTFFFLCGMKEEEEVEKTYSFRSLPFSYFILNRWKFHRPLKPYSSYPPFLSTSSPLVAIAHSIEMSQYLHRL